jgi:hypothetical protein
MSTVLTETSTYGATVTVPSDGDAANAASVNGALQTLANRTKYLNDAILNASIVGSGVSSDGTDIDVGAFVAVVGNVALTSPATTVLTTGLTPSTWYYLYAQPGVGLILTTTAPDSYLKYENLSSTRLYLCSVYATGATTVRPFRFTFGSRRTMWALSKMTSGTADVLSGGTASSYTDVNFGAWAPPHVRLLSLRYDCNLTNSISTLALRTNGDTTGESFLITGIRKEAGDILIECDSSRIVEYQVGTAGSATLTALGFSE